MIKKLGTWEHDDIVCRIGSNWLEWKYAYDTAWSYHYLLDDPVPEIWIDDNTTDFLILQHFSSPDCGMIPTLVLDAILPYWETDQLLTNEDFIEKCGYVVVSDSRYDSILDLSRWEDFDHYKSSISSRLTRYWNKCEKTLEVEIYYESFNDFYFRFSTDSFKYWRVEKEVVSQPVIGSDYFVGLHREPLTRTLLLNGTSVGGAWFYIKDEEILWINSPLSRKSQHSKYALGNYLLLKSIQDAFDKHKVFNMGIDIFDYKQNWLPERMPVKGIRRR